MGKLIGADRGIVLVFAIALAARIFTSLSQVYFGVQGIPSLFPINAWADFYGIYVSWLQQLGHGLVPYRDFTNYIYTPLFLYTLNAFYLVGGAHAASVPIVLSDAATAPVVCLIVKKVANARVALIAGLAYALCPFALFYEGYLWLSSQPLTFFMLLAIYLLRADRPTYSAFSMALAILFKQEALFILPVWGIWFAMRFKKSVWKGAIVLLSTLLAVSLPFLLLSPIAYLSSLTYLNPSVPPSAVCVNKIVNGSTIALCNGVTRGLSGLFPVSPVPVATAQAGGVPTEYLVDKIAAFVSPFVFLLVMPALIVTRKARNAPEIFAAYSTIGFLLLFYYLTHTVLFYRDLPVYALLFAASTNRRALLVSTVAPIAALLLLPEGPAAPLPQLIAILAILAVQGEAGRDPSRGGGWALSPSQFVSQSMFRGIVQARPFQRKTGHSLRASLSFSFLHNYSGQVQETAAV